MFQWQKKKKTTIDAAWHKKALKSGSRYTENNTTEEYVRKDGKQK